MNNDFSQSYPSNDDKLIDVGLQNIPQKRKRRWFKNIIAIVIGMAGGFFLRLVIGIPLAMIFLTDEGFPPDIALILEIFTGFVAGALAGSLVPRFGWLFGMLTKIFEIIASLFIISFYIYIVASDPSVGLSFALLQSPEFRVMLFGIASAIIAGALAERYRNKIFSFLGTIFGFIGGSLGCLIYALGGVFYLYILYRAGKALFEEGAIFKALLIALVIGPIISYVGGAILIGLGYVLFWIFSKIYNWYAEDLGLEPLE